MRRYTATILIPILAAILIVGLLIKNSLDKATSPLMNGKPKVNREIVEISESTASQGSLFDAQTPRGAITGDLCFPSESIPPLNLYFINLDTGENIVITSELNQTKYTVENVPIGIYVAFAYVKGMNENAGGYTEAVECGLTVSCNNHQLINFSVTENDTVIGVDICDWYGAEIPDDAVPF